MENTMPNHCGSQFPGGSLIEQPNSHCPDTQLETTNQGEGTAIQVMPTLPQRSDKLRNSSIAGNLRSDVNPSLYSCAKDMRIRSTSSDTCSSNSGHDFRQRYDPPTGLPLNFGATTVTTFVESPPSKQRAATLDSTHDEARPSGSTIERESSLAIVPYTGGRHLQAGFEMPGLRCRLFNLTSNDQRGIRFAPASSPVTASTADTLCSGGREVSSDLAETRSLKRGFTSSRNSSISLRQERRPEWVVVSAEQAEHAARKLRSETEKNKTLQAKLERHKRDRVLIYDAAMKQAAEKEEEGVKDAERVFERERLVMRAEVDHELHKINGLHEKRCRDYAQMVSDECEGEISKASAELREGWAREKKTIAQLVREGAGEDRQVAVIARAVMEHLQEEENNQVTALREEIYAEVKTEFENREVSLRDALQGEFQADLDGQLLLAEIRHQKEMDQLRTELRGDHAPSAEKGGETIVVYNRGTTPKQRNRGDHGNDRDPDSDPISLTPSPSLPRHSLQHKMPFRDARNSGNDSGVAPAPAVRGKSGLVKKLPIFRTPAQKAPASSDIKTTDMKSGRSNEPIAPLRPRIKRSSRSPKTGNIASALPKPLDYVPQKHEDEDEDQNENEDDSITSALTVSPTKTSGIAGTSSMGVESTFIEKASTHEPQRPKKRGKRLFTAQT